MEFKSFKKYHFKSSLRYWVVMVLLLFSHQHLYSAKEPENIKEATKALYEFRFQDADSIITQLENDYPYHYLPHLARSQYHWWRIISQNDTPAIRKNYLESLELAEEMMVLHYTGTDPGNKQIFYLINIYASRARLDLLNGDYFGTLRHLRKSYNYISRSFNKENEYQPFLLTSGLYYYTMGYGLAKYPFLRIYSFWFHKGDVLLGISMLENAANGNDELIKTEANYFLMKIYMELEENMHLARPYAGWLVEKYPDNIIYAYHYYKIAVELNDKKANVIKSDLRNLLENNPQLSSEQITHFHVLLSD